MSKPVVVNIPHSLGREEAVRRLQSGIAKARGQFGHVFNVQQENWVGDTLSFQVSALGQQAAGDIDVREDHVVLTVTLPWLLAKFAHAIQGGVTRQGTLMLEKK